MTTTHALMGVAVAAVALPGVGEPAPVAAVLAAAFLGGVAPDLDLVATHRKTLHFPALLPVATGVVGLRLHADGTVAGVVLFAFLGSAALHSVVDVLGGGVEPEPWRRTSQEAVYNHLLGRWHRPKRWVRYAGAPEDFLLTAVCGIVVVTTATPSAFDRLAIGLVLFSGLFALVRKRIPDLIDAASRSIPLP
ncbi:metal-dependent hydrolase [Halosolutus gelatinilyticus]|uniref:metal-dependent hydrolase n=1 Tax=Halosolutus gelatinilyticus TaxID=2931975 RepID=UPI001FF4C65D|nr:metal-dependent hydrolase [Halosolutus gelatinilyticus]